MTHVKRKDSALNEIGEVLWHSLDENGNINYYDVKWPSGEIEENIPANMLTEIMSEQHEHETRTIDDKKTLNEKRKKRKQNLDRWYYGLMNSTDDEVDDFFDGEIGFGDSGE